MRLLHHIVTILSMLILADHLTGISCNMGRRDLPDMYAQGPQARGLRAYISGKSRLPMLQVICIISSTLKIKIETHNHIDLLRLYKECLIHLC